MFLPVSCNLLYHAHDCLLIAELQSTYEPMFLTRTPGAAPLVSLTYFSFLPREKAVMAPSTPPTEPDQSSGLNDTISPTTEADDPALHVLAAQTSSAPSPDAQVVLLDLHTTVVIPDFHRYYSGSIETFHPPYHALSDGSLIATPFIRDSGTANVLLAVLSASAMFFIMNTISAGQFLRRGRVKNMGLFYLLFVSQILGAVAMLTLMATFFDQFSRCTA